MSFKKKIEKYKKKKKSQVTHLNFFLITIFYVFFFLKNKNFFFLWRHFCIVLTIKHALIEQAYEFITLFIHHVIYHEVHNNNFLKKIPKHKTYINFWTSRKNYIYSPRADCFIRTWPMRKHREKKKKNRSIKTAITFCFLSPSFGARCTTTPWS